MIALLASKLQYFQSEAIVEGFKSTPHRNSDTVTTPICPSVNTDFISPVALLLYGSEVMFVVVPLV